MQSVTHGHRRCDFICCILLELLCKKFVQYNKSSAVAEMGDHLATIDMGRKLGLCPLFGDEGAGSPSNTMSLGSRPTFLPSGILIH